MAGRQAVARREVRETEDLTSAAPPALVDARALDPAEGGRNPARDLQRDLAAAAASGAFGPSPAAPEAVEGRWSQRRTLAFIVVSCGAFWAAVAFAMSRLF